MTSVALYGVYTTAVSAAVTSGGSVSRAAGIALAGSVLGRLALRRRQPAPTRRDGRP